MWLGENAIPCLEGEKINKLFVVIKLRCVQTAPYLFPHNFYRLHIAVIYLLISILLPCRHYLFFFFFWLKTTEIYCLTLLEIKVQNQGFSRTSGPLETLRGFFLGSFHFWYPQVFLGLWLHHFNLCLHLLPLYLCLSLYNCPSYSEDTSH